MITAPCVVDGMTDAEYHSDPVEGGSLSSSGARTILKSPAHYAYERANRIEKTTYDVGHAVHSAVLGVGAEVVLCDFDTWRTKTAQDAKADAYADGKTPILAKDYEPIQAMSEAVMAHPTARAFLEQVGKPEQSGFAIDPESGVWIRIRPDFLPDQGNGRTIIVDLKTSVSADPQSFGKFAFNYGYHQQDAFTSDGLTLARGDVDPAFVFVIVEKDPPYLVSVVELDSEAKRIGRERNRRALAIFAECMSTNTWPGYSPEVTLIALPRYAEIQHEEQYI